MHTRKRNWWRSAAGALGLLSALGSTGCGKEPIPPPPAVVNRVTLQSFSGPNACAELETYLEDTAVLQMRSQLEAARDGVPSWGWWGGWGLRGELDGFAQPAAANATSGPQNYTTTNNQVAGVDEADFVKNDGTRIFTLSGEKLYAAKSWPAAELAVLGSLKVEGYPRELFLDGTNRAVVFSSIYTWYPFSNAGGVECLGLRCGYSYANTVKVTEVDVSDLANLRVLKETWLPGHYQSARKVGSSVRLVLSDDFNFPPGFKWGPDWSEGLWEDKARLRAAYDRVIRENETLIRNQTLADWLPAARIKEGAAELVVPHACEAFSKVNAPTRLGQVSVVTLDLAANSIHRNTVLTEPGEIYASQQNLYIATRHWWWWPQPGQRDTTYLHKFDITQPDSAAYVASGTVDGYVVDQFSLDESASGHLRVVTTVQTRVPDTDPFNPWGRLETTNRLSVLGENAGALEVVGRSPDLAKGERVQSARIVGDKGFVVTFRQVDPLFTFDLSDPTNPRVMGELKIPGFSTYIHPMDATHLLTIGTFVPEPVNGQPVNWQARALQLAIFDVSDLSNPRQTHTQLVGTAYGWSEAAHEHKAFNYFAAKKLLAIPFADWSPVVTSDDFWSGFTSDLRVYSVDPVLGFVPRGAVSMKDLYTIYRYDSWSYYWEPYVRRSVMADDFVYAISDSGIRVAHVADLSTPVATARFEKYVDVKP